MMPSLVLKFSGHAWQFCYILNSATTNFSDKQTPSDQLVIITVPDPFMHLNYPPA